MSVFLGMLLLTCIRFLLVASAVAFFFGVVLLIAPQFVNQLGTVMNRWISVDEKISFLDRVWNMERAFFRHHKGVGVVVLMASTYTLTYMAHGYGHALVLMAVNGFVTGPVAAWLTDSLTIILVVSSVFALFIGNVVIVRPSLLKSVERWANRWISSSPPTTGCRISEVNDNPHGSRLSRVLGFLISLGSLYVMANLWLFIAQY